MSVTEVLTTQLTTVTDTESEFSNVTVSWVAPPAPNFDSVEEVPRIFKIIRDEMRFDSSYKYLYTPYYFSFLQSHIEVVTVITAAR